MDLSIVILNYNVRSFLEQTLRTVIDASEGLAVEIFVVDNNSSDGSQEMVRSEFPDVKLICNEENLGFARGNNIALRQCQGRYILLLNPDTIVSRDTLHKMVTFLDEHPEAGAAGCKILNLDGSLQLACRRAFPTPTVALFKIIGLSGLFPKSKLFGRYNLTYMDPDQVHEVDALSGSFIMVRKKVTDSVGLLDEAFFMYGEDLDWFYRIKEAGWKIYYVPTAEIIHFKGESTKRSPKIKNRINFYKAMHIFVQKHMRKRYRFFPEWLLTFGIVLRGIVSLLVKILERYKLPLFDLLLVVIGFTFGILTRYGDVVPLPPHRDWRSYVIIYGTCCSLWSASFYLVGLYDKNKYSTGHALFGVFVGFLAVTSAPFFMKQYAFSRAVALFALIYNSVLVAGWRLIVHFLSRSPTRKIGHKRILILGTGIHGVLFLKIVRENPAWEYDVIGFVDDERQMRGRIIEGVRVLGLVEDIPDLVKEYRIDDIVISDQTVPYSQILKLVSNFGRSKPLFKLISGSIETATNGGKTVSPDDLPLIELAYKLKPSLRHLRM